MSIIKDGFCSKLTSEFDGKMRILRSAETQLNSKLNDLTSYIQIPREWSPHWYANILKRSIAANINSIVPDFTTMNSIDELVSLINACLFTQSDSQLSKPSTFLRQITGNIKSNAFGILDTLANIGEGIIPEFNIAKLFNELKNQIKGPGINLIIPQAVQAIECMSAICGIDVMGRIESLESFLTKYSLGLDGEINVNDILVSQGINIETVGVGINTCITQIDFVMNRIDSSVEQGVELVKRAIPEDDWEE